VSTEDGSLQWVARAVCLETVKHGSVRDSGCNSPGLLGKWTEVRPRRIAIAGRVGVEIEIQSSEASRSSGSSHVIGLMTR